MKHNFHILIAFSLGGLVLDYAVANYNGLAIFQPVINGEYRIDGHDDEYFDGYIIRVLF